MCDSRVILRRPKRPRPVYHITSSSFTFEVKTDKALGIYLSEDIERRRTCWIGIGINHSEIRNCNGVKKIFETRDAINAGRFKSFWVSWYNNCIRVGREGNYTPFMEIKEDTSQMQYVAFNIMGSRKTAALRINLPPVRIPEKIICFDDGIPIWVTIGKKNKTCIPTDAILGSCEKDRLYVIRASHQGSLIPGKFVSSNGTAYISWGGEVHIKNEFEVLCGYNFKWVKTIQNRIPVNAVKGGYSEVMHEPLYVGRVEHNGCIIPGKVQPSHKCCYIAYKNMEVSKSDFEILVSLEELTECYTYHEYIEYSSSEDSEFGFRLFD